MFRNALVLVFLLAGLGAAVAWHRHHGGSYAGQQTRAVKALPDEQIADLKAGRGMGMAVAAELNGYPGPVHVLDHADALDLSTAQRAEMKKLYDAMKAQAIRLGVQLIAQEIALDRAFSERRATPESIAAATAEIGATRAALRAAHLRTHLETVTILSDEQVRRYVELRGYRLEWPSTRTAWPGVRGFPEGSFNPQGTRSVKPEHVL